MRLIDADELLNKISDLRIETIPYDTDKKLLQSAFGNQMLNNVVSVIKGTPTVNVSVLENKKIEEILDDLEIARDEKISEYEEYLEEGMFLTQLVNGISTGVDLAIEILESYEV